MPASQKQLEGLAKVERYSAPAGFVTIQVWRTPEGWRFDGPSSAGPAHVRSNPRNVAWTGPIDEDHAAVLLSRLKSMTDHVEVVLRKEPAYVA